MNGVREVEQIVSALADTVDRRDAVIAEQRAVIGDQDATLRAMEAEAARKDSMIAMLRGGGANDG